ncbi:hypothetical protein [Microvirga antarctica]|uniref:hypothetical protein n=1 Tax=Microvirga antarctica TaxID=2819233 RepID=UPI0031BB13B1
MISESSLTKAVERGILTADQLTQLQSLAQTNGLPGNDPDDEKLRFVTGFSDIFVTIGIGLFASAVAYFADTYGEPVRWAALAVVSWALAEFFTRRRRMALPSIVLLCLFAVAVFGAAYLGLNRLSSGDPWHESIPFGVRNWRPAILTSAALITLGLVALHYWRFRLPITVAAGAAALAGVVVGLVFIVAPDFADRYAMVIILAAGLSIFTLAMRFDLSDPARITRRTDIAFWLHLLAAPMIVHPMIAILVLKDADFSASMALAILAIFVALGAIAVIVDRRAILVSGLAYAGIAFKTLITGVGLTDHAAAATLLVLGAFVLLLSAGWRPLRAFLLKLLPSGLARRLPHPILTP